MLDYHMAGGLKTSDATIFFGILTLNMIISYVWVQLINERFAVFPADVFYEKETRESENTNMILL